MVLVSVGAQCRIATTRIRIRASSSERRLVCRQFFVSEYVLRDPTVSKPLSGSRREKSRALLRVVLPGRAAPVDAACARAGTNENERTSEGRRLRRMRLGAALVLLL